jgi:hypothetical protein
MSSIRRAKPTEIFLSHAYSDRKFLNRLVKVLRTHGIRYWYSTAHLKGAQQWHDEIGRALDRCDWFCVVLSPASTRSEWVKRELRYVLNEDKYRAKIVPLLIRPCQHKRLSWTLGSFQFVKFTGGFEAGCKSLLKIWGG